MLSSIANQDSRPSIDRNALAAGILLALAAMPVLAEEPASPAAEEEAAAANSPPGLPSGLKWTFNLDATAGTFGFGD